jgi:hypothetical protein
MLGPVDGGPDSASAPVVTFSDQGGHDHAAVAARHTLTGTRCSCGTTYLAATPEQAADHHAHHVAELAARWAALDHNRPH